MLKGRLVIKEQETNKVLVDKKNLITYQGREFVLPALLKVINPNINTPPNFGIFYLGLGSGGLLSPNDPTTVINPAPTDVNLYNIVAGFNPTVAGTTANGMYRAFNNVSYLQDPTNGNAYLIAVLTTSINLNEFANTLISEAGLFLSDYSQPNLATKFYLFSHITFPAINKSANYSLAFTWYLYS